MAGTLSMGKANVSICALARRATLGQRLHPGQGGCFNLRPRTEGDERQDRQDEAIQGFNLRPRTEGDEHDQPAPAVLFGFNLRPRTEGDTPGSGQAAEYYLFQSAPSHGGRPV